MAVVVGYLRHVHVLTGHLIGMRELCEDGHHVKGVSQQAAHISRGRQSLLHEAADLGLGLLLGVFDGEEHVVGQGVTHLLEIVSQERRGRDAELVIYLDSAGNRVRRSEAEDGI